MLKFYSYNYFLFKVRRLNKGEELKKGQYLTSKNGRFKLILNNNSRLGLYFHDFTLWEPVENVHRLVMMQDGGYLIMFNEMNQIVAVSDSNGKGDHLILQDDANLVLLDSQEQIQWQSNTISSKKI